MTTPSTFTFRPKFLRSSVFGTALLLSASALTQEAPDENYEDFTLIYAGQVLDVPGQPAKTDQTIIIHEGKIVGVEDGFLEDKDALILDYRDMFFLPGLIDSHVHLRGDRESGKPDDAVRLEAGDVTLQAAAHARTTLMAGFTAVQDVGGPKEIFALRRAINKGLVPGPHIRASGSAVAATGGHGDVHGYRGDILRKLQSDTICDGVADCRRAVRQAVKNGADLIKITATGGVLSNTNAGTGQQLTQDELEAIVQTAVSLGRKVTAHAHDKGGIEAALRAGVHSIEHGSFMDEETARLFKEKGAVLVPTVLAGKTVEKWAADPNTFLPPNSVKKALEVGPVMQDMARLAYENGVTIAFGTDSGVSNHGDNAEEFIYMTRAGMSEMEAIESATTVAAKHISLSDVIGTLEAGKYADLIGVDASPLDDITELLDVDFVMKGGVVYNTPF